MNETPTASDPGSPCPDDRCIRERLLNAAERLLAANGVSGASIREITAAAGANVAAVNYHFGSRDAFMLALITRRLDPLNQERLRLLDACMQASEKPAPEDILRALAAPALRLCFEHPHFARLVARFRSDPDPTPWREYRARQAEVTERFRQALSVALPSLPSEEVGRRLHYLLGGLQQVWAHAPLDQPLETVENSFLTFFGAGLRAGA